MTAISKTGRNRFILDWGEVIIGEERHQIHALLAGWEGRIKTPKQKAVINLLKELKGAHRAVEDAKEELTECIDKIEALKKRIKAQQELGNEYERLLNTYDKKR